MVVNVPVIARRSLMTDMDAGWTVTMSVLVSVWVTDSLKGGY